MRTDEPKAAPPVAPPAAAGRHGVNLWLGIALILIMTAGWVTHNLTTKVLTGEGVGPPVIIFLRSVAIVGTLWVWLVATGQQIRFALPVMGGLFLLSLLSVSQSYAMVFSISFIPVGLALLLLYLFPVITALISAALGDSRLTGVSLGGAIAAFVGLAVALGVGELSFDIYGILLGVFSAVTISLNIVLSARLMKRLPRMSVLLHLMIWVLLISAVYVAVAPEPGWPTTDRGWMFMALSAFTYALAMSFFYMAVAALTPPRASFAMNIEPVATLIAAALLLDETLGAWQYAGAAIVIGAIVVVSWMNLQRAKRARPVAAV